MILEENRFARTVPGESRSPRKLSGGFFMRCYMLRTLKFDLLPDKIYIYLLIR